MLYNYMFSNLQEEVYLLSTILLKYKAGTCTVLESETNCSDSTKKKGGKNQYLV